MTNESKTRRRAPRILMLALMAPFLGGANDCGDSPIFARDPAPDIAGDWRVTYEDDLNVKITIGAGADAQVFERTVPANGGTVEITGPNDTPISFDLDCARPEVVCPSEVWETDFEIERNSEEFTHRFLVQIPQQSCDGERVPADPSECGEGTDNPDCESVCIGTLVTVRRGAFGTINNEEDGFDILLSGGIATNGVNCALLALSVARGELQNSGSVETEDWRVDAIPSGEIVSGYAGACLWAQPVGTPEDPDVAAVVLGATVELSTSFSAARR